MKKLLPALLFAFILLALVAVSSKRVLDKRGLLWEISSNGLKTPSYLFGTYHLAGKSFVDSLGYVEPKLKMCKTVVGELIIDSSMYVKMMPMLMLTNTSLDKLFTPTEYQTISDTLNKVLHVDVNLYKTLKPSAVEVVIEGLLAPKTIAADNTPMDIYFQTEGRKFNDQVIGLETLEFQGKLLFDGDMETQKRHLLYMVHNITKERKDLVNSYSFYINQDIQHLYDLINKDDGYSKDENDKLIKDRNLNWMQQLPAIMAANSTFIAVGSGHLLGEYGLISQLRLKGYTVTPVFK